MTEDDIIELGYLAGRIPDKDFAIVAKYLNDYPVKLAALATELGLLVFKTPMQPSISGLIQPSANATSGFEIKINKFEPLERQRFTLAHEIGHYLLHRDFIASGITDSIMYRSLLSSQKEAEANKLAAWLIMPARLVKEKISELSKLDNNSLIEELSNQFKVSEEAMKYRIGV